MKKKKKKKEETRHQEYTRDKNRRNRKKTNNRQNKTEITDTKETRYLKFERITGVKSQFHNDLTSWVKYLNHLGYVPEQVDTVWLANGSNMLIHGGVQNMYPAQYKLVDHHVCHQ